MKLKKPTSLFKCWLRNRNFTQNTLDTRCQIKSPMWPNRTWWFLWVGGKSYRRFTLKSPSTIYPQIACTIYPPFKSSNFEQNFKCTQHHALLHKGLFCERPKIAVSKIIQIKIVLNKIEVIMWSWNLVCIWTILLPTFVLNWREIMNI